MDKSLLSELEEAFNRPDPPLPDPHDYIRITAEHDVNFGCVAKVLWVEGRRGLRSVHIKLNPFGDGLRLQRPIKQGCFEILTGMEVIAEASR